MSPEKTEAEHITRKEREKRRLREDVIKAAAELISTRTYEKTSVHQIAERAEVSVGTIYNLFEGKDSIFEGLLTMINENIDSKVEEVLNSTSDPLERIRSVVNTYMNFCERYRDFMIIIHNENPVRMKGIMKKFFTTQVKRMEGLYLNAIQDGILKKENAHLLSLITFGYISSLVHELSNGEEAYSKDDFMSLFDRTLLIPLQRCGRNEKVTEDSR